MLEEPPLSTTIVILSDSNFFLPTILSRCKLIELDKEISIDKDEKEEILEIANNFSQLEIGERLKIAQDLAKDKKEALLFLEKLIIVTRNKMVNNQEVSLAKNLKILQKYYREIKQSNVNFRLGLENLFLEM